MLVFLTICGVLFQKVESIPATLRTQTSTPLLPTDRSNPLVTLLKTQKSGRSHHTGPPEQPGASARTAAAAVWWLHSFFFSGFDQLWTRVMLHIHVRDFRSSLIPMKMDSRTSVCPLRVKTLPSFSKRGFQGSNNRTVHPFFQRGGQRSDVSCTQRSQSFVSFHSVN